MVCNKRCQPYSSTQGESMKVWWVVFFRNEMELAFLSWNLTHCHVIFFNKEHNFKICTMFTLKKKTTNEPWCISIRVWMKRSSLNVKMWPWRFIRKNKKEIFTNHDSMASSIILKCFAINFDYSCSDMLVVRLPPALSIFNLTTKKICWAFNHKKISEWHYVCNFFLLFFFFFQIDVPINFPFPYIRTADK